MSIKIRLLYFFRKNLGTLHMASEFLCQLPNLVLNWINPKIYEWILIFNLKHYFCGLCLYHRWHIMCVFILFFCDNTKPTFTCEQIKKIWNYSNFRIKIIFLVRRHFVFPQLCLAESSILTQLYTVYNNVLKNRSEISLYIIYIIIT